MNYIMFSLLLVMFAGTVASIFCLTRTERPNFTDSMFYAAMFAAGFLLAGVYVMYGLKA